MAITTTAQVNTGRCESYTGSICSPIYGSTSTTVYLNDNSITQQELELKMREYFGVFSAVERESCGPYILSLFCSQFLPTCTYDIEGNARPRYPCSGFCQNYGLVTPPTENDKTLRYGVPKACSKYAYFFGKPEKSPTPANKVLIETIDSFLRPVCWPSEVSSSTFELGTQINHLSPSPIEAFRLNPPQGSTVGSGITLSPSELKLISDNDIGCDVAYDQFVSKTNTILVAAKQHTELQNISIDFPTYPCPTLLTAIPSSKYGTDEEPCAIPCPTLTFTNDQYKTQDTLVIIFNSLSLASLFLLCISWTFFPSLRLQNYVFYYILCISAMTLSLFVLIPIARAQGITIAESLCETPTMEYHMKGYPMFQGMVTAFTYMSATAWGLIMVFDIFVQVVVGRHMQKGSRDAILKERLYHAFSWFWGIYSVIGGLASEQFGSTVIVGGSYALIIPSRHQQAREGGIFNAGNPFFYYPLLVLTFISVILMFAVLIKLIWFRAQTATTGLRLATFVRLFIFIIANTFIICVFLVYSIDVNEKRDELDRRTTEFTQCLHLIRTFARNIDPVTICGTAPDHPLDFNILILTVVLFNGMGVIAFLIYGTTTDLLFSWFGTLYVVCGFDSFKKYEKDYRRNRKSTKMNTTRTSQHPAGEKSKTSRSGHTGSTIGSGILTSHHHHNDSHTNPGGRSHFPDDGSRFNGGDHHRATSQDPKSRGSDLSVSGYQPRKTVFQYGNQKQQQQRRNGNLTPSGSQLHIEPSSAQGSHLGVEMATLNE